MDTLRDRLTWECGVARRSLTEGGVCGDSSVFRKLPHGFLAAVIDGSGHGPEAAAAAGLAQRWFEETGDGALAPLLEQCHRVLAGTRGAAISLVAFDQSACRISWLGVGNVEARLVHKGGVRTRDKETLLCARGIVGYRLPPMRQATVAVQPDDLLYLMTDGIPDPGRASAWSSAAVQSLAELTVEQFSSRRDDALVLVVRFSGSPT